MKITDRVESELLGLSVSVQVESSVKIEYEIYLTDEALRLYTDGSLRFSSDISEDEFLKFEQALISLLELESVLESLETENEVQECFFDKYNLKLGYKADREEYSYFVRVGTFPQATLSGCTERIFYPLLKDIGSIKYRTHKLEEEARRVSAHLKSKLDC